MLQKQERLRSDTVVFLHEVPKRWLKTLRGRSHTLQRGTLAIADARAQSIYHVVVDGTTEFHDYETFGSDEHGVIGFRREQNLGTGSVGVTLLQWQQGFGGELRVEIDISGSLQPDGTLNVNVQSRFYEGASEGTHELEDTRSYQTLVWPGTTSNFEIHLANDEDDWATVRASIGSWRIF
jgi:hypothetical protein